MLSNFVDIDVLFFGLLSVFQGMLEISRLDPLLEIRFLKVKQKFSASPLIATIYVKYRKFLIGYSFIY